MYLKILKKDILKKKIITIAVSTFIVLSAFLVASGANMVVTLANALDTLFMKADVPHFVQYHAGEIDQGVIDEWTRSNLFIDKQQTSKMLNINGSNIYFREDIVNQGNGVMEFMFVKQNEDFDYLLDLESKIVKFEAGEIGVPIYFMEKNNLEIGDTILIKNDEVSQTFEIKSFIRDAQMNPSIVSSKRFVVSNQDFELLEKDFTDIEYQISFMLKNKEDLSTFSNEYSLSDMPKKGPTIDIELLKVLNVITDGLVFVVVFFISLLLNIIAVLCLRFTILSTIEEDYKEIGVMKAIGFKQKQIKKVYMTKYIFIATVACVIGYLMSMGLKNLFLENILLYVGSPELSILEQVTPFVAMIFVFAFIIISCAITLNKFKKISAVEALRMGNTGETYTNKKLFSVHRSKWLDVNIVIGFRDVFLRFKTYILLLVVFLICTFIIVVPLNFHNTINSEEFITYMGMGNSDILIDLRQTEDIQTRYELVLEKIANDNDVVKYSPLITSKFEFMTEDGMIESLLIETGDFNIFPLNYLEGDTPVLNNEIALSYLNAEEFDKKVGDSINVIVEGVETSLLVTGIYQDVTNGGKTAKANIRPNYETASWYMISVNISDGISVSEKMTDYIKVFNPAKVTDMEGYFRETFGNTINQLWSLTIIATVIAIVVTIMITSLFLKMLIAKDFSQIIIMKSIGFSVRNIQTQYIMKSLLVLNSGIILGAIISNTLGQGLIGVLLSKVGVSNISFVINPVEAYILCPLLLITVVSLTIWVSTKSIKTLSLSDLQVE